MQFYDFNFIVKYNDIFNELKNKLHINLNCNNNDTELYCFDDIKLICSQLYIYELHKVFYINYDCDTNKNDGITLIDKFKQAFNKLNEYENFKQIITKYIPHCYRNYFNLKKETQTLQHTPDYMIHAEGNIVHNQHTTDTHTYMFSESYIAENEKKTQNETDTRYINSYLSTLLFSIDLFYITHQCICDIYTKGYITDENLTTFDNVMNIFFY